MPIFQLTETLLFPPPDLSREDGLLAVGGDLSLERLVMAYSLGIFPWYSEGQPILWWSPDPRLILNPSQLHVPKRLDRTISKRPFRITYDAAFERVIRNCAAVPRPDQDGTWITEAMRTAYLDLHAAGRAHSIEAWEGDTLVGGVYGIAIGQCFFGESMFAHRADASKVAFVHLVRDLAAHGFTLIDCQVTTDHLLRFGAHEIPRAVFLERLKQEVRTDTDTVPW